MFETVTIYKYNILLINKKAYPIKMKGKSLLSWIGSKQNSNKDKKNIK